MHGLRSFFIHRFLPFSIAMTAFLSAKGQLCDGSLGDPVVNITFGPGGSSYYNPPNGYKDTATNCPNDGYYHITNTTSDCFANTWVTIPSDHTGNGGNFLLVNANYVPGDFFVDTVTTLCSNTTYEFAAWVMNVMKPVNGIKPNITFTIETPDSIILQRFDTGDISLIGQWTQYGFYFSTPANNSRIVIRMKNNAPGGYGNDVALDDITFRPCGPRVKASISGNSDTAHICADNKQSYILTADVSALYQSPAFQWQSSSDSGRTWQDIPGATSVDYVWQPRSAPGIYSYRLSVMDARNAGMTTCRINSNGVAIHVHPMPVVDAGPDRFILVGNPNKFGATAEGEELEYTWTPPTYLDHPKALNPSVSPPSDMTYTLSATSIYGCSNSDNVYVKVVAGIFVPTAFTPNNDGKNDKWEIPFLDPAFEGEVSLFNRYGQLVYHSFASKVSWDGTINGVPQASGVYVYVVTSKSINLNLKGTVTLIR